MSKKPLLKSLALAALLSATGASQAAIAFYDNQASFLAAVGQTGVDTFNNLPSFGATASPIDRNAGPFTYVAAVLDGDDNFTSFFGAGTPGDPWLSTDSAVDTMRFSGFSADVVAVGGNFFGSDFNGEFVNGGAVTLTATDGDGSFSSTVVSGSASSFYGFVSSNGSLISLTVAAVQPSSGFMWPTANDLTLAAAVPEPETYGMMLAGLAFVGFLARRRRG